MQAISGFDIDVGLGEECVPMLPKMNFLINDLNQSRNFYAFLKQARREFKLIASVAQ